MKCLEVSFLLSDSIEIAFSVDIVEFRTAFL